MTYRLRFEAEQEVAGDRFTAHCQQSIGGGANAFGGDLDAFPIPTHQVPDGIYDAADKLARATLLEAAVASRASST